MPANRRLLAPASFGPAALAPQVYVTKFDKDCGWLQRDVFFLDRHWVSCPENTALVGFRLVTQPAGFNGKAIAYNYSCQASPGIVGTSGLSYEAPRVNATTEGYLSLDATPVECPLESESLNSWNLWRYGAAGAVAVLKFRCATFASSLKCAPRATAWADASDWKLRSLELHDVTCGWRAPRACRRRAPGGPASVGPHLCWHPSQASAMMYGHMGPAQRVGWLALSESCFLHHLVA